VTTPDETLARVALSLRQWRGWLDELLALFLDELPPGERAYARLIGSVLERSAAYGEWHLVARTAVRWQREAAGLPAVDLDAAVGGRFRDWFPPDEGVVDDVARRIARAEADVS
jgi:hypothetical protein